MRAYATGLLTLCAFTALAGACAEQAAGPSGPRVEITVSPLTLPGVLDVDYALAVFNADPAETPVFSPSGAVTANANTANLVWSQPSVTSGAFGDGAGGAISYVGPCDASLGGASTNYVALALKTVAVANGQGSYPASGDMNLLDDQNSVSGGDNAQSADTDADFDNPCPYDDPCLLPVSCSENQDTSVVFNLTIMRDADQGFFDIAVNFDDIFCSAKVDCTYDDAGADRIELLFDADGERGQTAVFGLACTDGPGGTGTVLHMNGARVECGDDLGEAMPREATATTCATDTEGVVTVYGMAQGSTQELRSTVLPVRWSDAQTATVLPLGGRDAGVVLQRLDDSALLGVVGDAAGASLEDTSLGNGGQRANTARNAGFTNMALAAWEIESSGDPHEYAMPAGYALSAVGSVFYDADGERVWMQADVVDIGSGEVSGEVPMFRHRNPQYPVVFGPAVALTAPAGTPYCTLTSVNGGQAVGTCSASGAVTSTRLNSGSLSGGAANVAVLWEISGENIEQAVLSKGTTGALGFSELGLLSDGSVVGTAWSDSTTPFGVVRWATRIAAPEELVLGGAITWKTPDVMAISGSGGATTVRRRVWDQTQEAWAWHTWSTASAFTLDNVAATHVTVAGYSARVNAIYGTFKNDDMSAVEMPWFAILPAAGSASVAMTALSTPDDLSESVSFLGELPTANLVTARLVAATNGDRTFAWQLAAAGETARGELVGFQGPAAVSKGAATSAGATVPQGCDAVLGSVAMDDDSDEVKAATWQLPTTGGAVVDALPRAQPAEILPAGAQVGSFVSFELDPTVEGNAWDAASLEAHRGDAVWQYASYHGSETLTCDNQPCDKVYWNTAIGFDPTVAGCRLIAEATAASGPSGLAGGETPDYTTYPLITVDVPLTSTADPAAPLDPVELLCRRNPLNGAQSGVQTQYTSVDVPQTFCHKFDGTVATSLAGDCEWTPYQQLETIGKPMTPTDTIPKMPRGL